LEALAFHYGRSDNTEKQMEYLRKAGEAAQKNFANAAALDYYGKLLALLKDDKEKTEIHLQRGQVFELLGNWDEAESDYRAALKLAKADAALTASAQFALGKINRLRGDYASALEWLAQAREARTLLNDTTELAQGLIETGMVLYSQGEYAAAREISNEGLVLAREVGDKLSAARALNALGNIVSDQGDYAAARALYEESLSLRLELGDKYGISASLNNLGNVAKELGNHAMARALYEESLSLDREMGDKWGVAITLSNVANVVVNQGDYVGARALSEESLRLRRELGDKEGIANSLNNLGYMVYGQGDYAAARAVYEESLRLRRELGDKAGIAFSLNNLGTTAYSQGDYALAQALFEESLRLCQEMDVKRAKAYALLSLGLLSLVKDNPEAGEHILHSLRMRVEMSEQIPQTSNLVGVAGLVLQAGHPRFAAQLLGAVESALKVFNAVMEPFIKPFHAQTLAAAKEALGEAAFQSAWEEGSQWSLEEAVKKALGEG
jgi:tetratricopeptide (TPR) repeat protein